MDGSGSGSPTRGEIGPPTAPPLRAQVASGMRWGTFDQGAQFVIRLAAAVVLTRLIAPRDFGLMGVVFVVLNLTAAVTGLGFGEALVQRADLERRHVTTAFTASALFGIALAAALITTSGKVALYFKEPELRGILVVLSAMLVLQALERTPNDMLVRELSFRRFYVSNTVAALVGVLVGIPMALAGQGVWALATMTLAEAVAATTLAWVFAIRSGAWSPKIGIDGRSLRELLGFSSYVVADRLLGYTLGNGDSLVIGRMLGAEPLGYYSLSYRVMLVPIQRLAKVMTSTAYPALARVQAEPERLRQGFLHANRYIAITCMPLMIGVAVTSHTLVPVVFGERWRPASTSMLLLALSGPGLLITFLSGSLYRAIGRPRRGLFRTGVSGALYLPAFFIGAESGINGVALGFTVATYLVLPVDLALSARSVDVPVRGLLANIGPAVVATGLMAVAACVTGWALDSASGGVRLTVMVVVGATVYGAAAAVLFPETLRHALRDIRRFRP